MSAFSFISKWLWICMETSSIPFKSQFFCSSLSPLRLTHRCSSSCQLIASLVYIFLITTFIKLTWLLLCLQANRHTHTRSPGERGEAKCTDFTIERRRQAICSFWHFFRAATVFDSFLSLYSILLFDFKYRFFCFVERLYRLNKHNMKKKLQPRNDKYRKYKAVGWLLNDTFQTISQQTSFGKCTVI